MKIQSKEKDGKCNSVNHRQKFLKKYIPKQEENEEGVGNRDKKREQNRWMDR